MTFTQFSDNYSISLNDQQIEAAQTINGPCLLLAVPGSGKTTVLVTRLGYMIHGCDIDPDSILTLTYTIAATKDMKERYINLFGSEEKVPKFRTIDGVCAKILSYYGKKLGRKPFEIEEESDKLKRIARIYKKITESPVSLGDARELSRQITYVKHMNLSEDEIKDINKLSPYPFSKIYKAYSESLISDKVMDYDDQMLFAYMLLKSDPITLEHFRKKFQYICVDEAQDVSKIQHMIISLLAGKNGNLFMTGDDDESIYGFRAAYPEALRNFESDHPDAKVLILEQNFRSNANIVYSADAFIQNNPLRSEKRMAPVREASSDIQKIDISERAEQYEYILKAASEGNEIAVLYKDNESVIPLVDLFNRKGLPFRLKSSDVTFFTNKAVRDIIAIMRFMTDTTDKDSFLRFYDKLNLYISKEEALKIVQSANGGCIMDAGMKMNFSKIITVKKYVEFMRNVKRIRNLKPEKVLDEIITTMGYGSYMEKMNFDQDKTDILRSVLQNTESLKEGLLRLKEIRDIIKNTDDTDCKTIFSTIHSSKGLEYETVYILDAVDGLFPKTEDNRRLFYVGLTRAKEDVFLFNFSGESSLIDEVKPGKEVKKNRTLSYKELIAELSEGRTVTHKKFGKGTVLGVKLPFADIQFGDMRKSLNVEIMAKNRLLKV